MRHSMLKKLSLAFVGGIFGLAVSFSAMAATPAGTLEGADSSSIYGWVWDSDSYGHVIPVEISVYPQDSSEAIKTATIKADHYQEKLQESIGDGYHGFKYSMDWNAFEQQKFRVTAYAVTEEERVFLGELTYHKDSEQFVLSSDATKDTQENRPEEPAPASLAPQGPGQITVTGQAPAALGDAAKTSVSTTAPGLGTDKASVTTAAPGQDADKSSASTDAPGQDTDKSSSSTTAPGQSSDSSKDTAGQSSSQEASKTSDTGKSQAESAQNSSAPGGSPDKLPSSRQIGPGFAPRKETKPKLEPVSLGMFTVTGYCGCDICCPSSISKLTYSGTEPQPFHTVSADIEIFPIGTRLMIGDTIYTVEDIGSNVIENKIDIFYGTHEEALAHGTTTEEVFSVPE